jgi:AAA domain
LGAMVDVFTFRADTPLPKEMPPQFLIAGVVHRSVTVFYGQQDTGKSMLALSLAVAVASGRPWLGRPVETSGPVAIVSGDPDGVYEYAERLDKVRGDLGYGEVRIISPSLPAEPAAWEEIRSETAGCALVVIDNLHQFTPGSLRGDEGIKLIYQEIDKLRRKIHAAVVVITHMSDHRGEFGYSQVPYGDSSIRFGPRWFARMWRETDRLEVRFSGNAGKQWQLSLSEPTDTPRFTELASATADELAQQRQKRKQNRAKAKLDLGADVAQWIVGNCNDGTVKSNAEAGRRIAASGKFTGTPDSHRVRLGQGAYPVRHDGNGTWLIAA